MSSIKVYDLDSAGYDLFQDSESFLNELTEERELEFVKGGFSIDLKPDCSWKLSVSISATPVSCSVSLKW